MKEILHLLNEKTEFIPSSEMKCPESAILLIIIGWCKSGKVLLQVSIAFFSGTVGQRWLSSKKKIGPYTYVRRLSIQNY